MPFRPLSCVFGSFVFRQRYVVAIMMHLGILNAYHLRAVVNIAMAEMKAPSNRSGEVDACPMYEDEYIEGIIGGRFNWTSKQESWIKAGFYVGYLLTHVPGGWLADKIGARHVMGSCLALSSLTTFLYPICLEANSLILAVAMRIFTGFFQGPIIPCISTFIQCWVPSYERGFLGGIAYGGSNLGTITGNIFTGLMIHWTGSWKTPFYVWACFGLAWYFFFLFMVFSRPDTHRFITQEEREYLEKVLVKKTKFKVPWKAILTSVPVYALLAGQFGHNYLFFTMLTDLPKYTKEILKLNIKSNALYTAIPFAAIWVSNVISAILADVVTHKNILSPLNVRRVWTSFSAIIPSCLLVVVVYIGCDRTTSIAIYSLAMFLHGPFYSGMKVNVNYITRYYGGIVMAIVNGLGSLAAVISTVVIGALTRNQSIEEWRLIMWIMLAVMIVTTFLFDFFTTVERQPWDFPELPEESQ